MGETLGRAESASSANEAPAPSLWERGGFRECGIGVWVGEWCGRRAARGDAGAASEAPAPGPGKRSEALVDTGSGGGDGHEEQKTAARQGHAHLTQGARGGWVGGARARAFGVR